MFANGVAAATARPANAAAEIAGMFCLCADEDLGEEIACDLQLNRWSAERIAVEIRRGRERDWNDYLTRLQAMRPAAAAAKIDHMFDDEDLTHEIASRPKYDRNRAAEMRS